MKSEKITKVKFRDGGLGGMVVTFEKPSKRSNENFRDEYKVNYKAPVHNDLLAQKGKLTAHLRDICRLSDDVADEEIYVTELSSNAYDQFVLRGNVRTVGESECPLKTPNVQDGTGYSKFLDVIEIIQNLYDEVRSYIHLDKKAQVDLVQVALDFAANDKKAPEGLEDMSDEEKEIYAREFLERKGYIAIQFSDPGDASPDGPATEEGESFETVDNPPVVVDVPAQPGFGTAPEAGKVISMNQPLADSEEKPRARKIN